MGIMHRKGIRSARITWWIRVMRLIRCILDPQTTAEPRSTTLIRGLQPAGAQAASKGHDHPSPAAPSPAAPPRAAPSPAAPPWAAPPWAGQPWAAPAAAPAPAARPAVRRRVCRGRPVRLREPAVRPAAGRRTYRYRQPAEYRAGQPPAPRSASWTGVFALPAVPDVLTQRELVVLAVRSGSQTAIRVDAQVVWLPARPVAERIPPAARVLTVTRSSASIPPPAPSASTAPSRSPTRPRWPGSRRSSTA
jgi:hypothetical protein